MSTPPISTSAALEAAATSWHILEDGSSQIGRGYQRGLVRIAARKAAEMLGLPMPDVSSLSRSTPAMAWFIYQGGTAEDARRLTDHFTYPREESGLRYGLTGEQGPWLGGGLNMLQQDFAEALPDQYAQTQLHAFGGDYSAVDETMLRSKALMRQVWPEAANEVDELIRYLVVADGDSLLSGSLMTTFGAIYVNTRLAVDFLALYETLIHETGHHSLIARLGLDTFLRNPNVGGQSPLRPDVRPLSGILQASFVLIRQLDGFHRALPLLTGRDLERATLRLPAWRRRLHSGLEVLEEHGEWTPRGEALLQSMLADMHSVAA